MITDKFLIDNGFKYDLFQSGGFWYLELNDRDENEVYQVSEDRSIIQYYDGFETFDLSEESFISHVECLSKSK